MKNSILLFLSLLMIFPSCTLYRGWSLQELNGNAYPEGNANIRFSTNPGDQHTVEQEITITDPITGSTSTGTVNRPVNDTFVRSYSGSDGCNSISGTYAVNDKNKTLVRLDGINTLVFCDDGGLSNEVSAAFAEARSYSIRQNGRTLVLKNASGSTIATLSRLQ